MGVPHFYTWLINRYPLIKSSYNQRTLPNIDWLFIDLNSIVYKCVVGEPSAFKGVIRAKRFEDICIQVFNCVNEVAQLIHPQKILYLAFDGVLPKAKLSQERAKRFKRAKKYTELINSLDKLGLLDKNESFNIDAITAGTEFMDEINAQIKFLILRKMKEDERWRKLTVYFSGVDVPGENEYKILEFIRKKAQEPGFNPNTTLCIYGADPSWIMLSLIPHIPFICILREQFQTRPPNCLVTKSHQQQNFYDFIWINVLRDYLDAEFITVKEKLGKEFSIDKVIDDLLFLYLFLQNDFLPRIFCLDVNINNFEKLIDVFKETLKEQKGFINNKGTLCWENVFRLLGNMSRYELKFITDKLEEQQTYQQLEKLNKKKVEDASNFDIQSNNKVLQEVKELKEEYEEYEEREDLEEEEEEDESIGSQSDEDNIPLKSRKQSKDPNTPPKTFHRKSGGKRSLKREGEIFEEDLYLDESNSSDSTSKSDNDKDNFATYEEKEEDKQSNEKSPFDQQETMYSESYSNDNMNNYDDDPKGNGRTESSKIDEESNFLAEQSQEEGMPRLFSTGILENDIHFISSLIKTYKKNKQEVQKLYYEEKFKINFNQDSSEVINILMSYIQGMQFVVSYYYTNCPSWSWYYPFHYSPLLSDLANLINISNFSQVTKIISNSFNFEKPFDPFKQLLFLFPQTSLNLLPESLRILGHKSDSVLFQYYSLDFQLDPFGGVFYSEYIPKIPLIDEKILDAEYQKGLNKAKLTKEEIKRNELGNCLVYEWDSRLQDYEVESSLPLYLEKFRVQIKITSFQPEQLPFDPSKIFDKPPQGTYKYHKSFPSLHFIQDKKIEMKSFCQHNTTFYRSCIRLGQRLNPTDYKQYRKLLDQPFYCMYPFLVPCFVMGIATPDQLITNVDYQNLPFSYKKAYHREYYTNLSRNVHQFYLMQMGVLFKESMLNFALIYLETEPRKDSLGNIYSPKPRIETIPINFLIDTNIMPYYRGRIDYNVKDILKEFALHTEVLINIGPPTGSLAKVVAYASEAYDFDNVEVKIIKTVPKLNSITSAIASKYNNHRQYRSLYNVAKRLGVDLQVIFAILDCLFVKTEACVNEKAIYPERVDIGLNLIQSKNQIIVPELVICNELKKFGKSRNRTFPHFQLSPEAIRLVEAYFVNHRPLFDCLTNKIRLKDPAPLTAKLIFPNAEDPNLELFKIYCWILKQEGSNLSLTNKASKVIPREGVRELEKVLDRSKNYFGDQATNILNKVFPYNPNFIIPKYLDNWVPPFFSRQPPWHKLGDRVVNLKVNGYNFAPFGAVGTVVGILGNKPENGFLKIKIEVLFDHSFIGGTNLGGRCNWGRGAVVNFDDIFNLNRWEKCITARDPKKSFKNSTWDGVFPKSYLPSFQTASEASETEEDSMRSIQKSSKVRTIVKEDLIKKLTSEKKKFESRPQGKFQQKSGNKTRSQSRNKSTQKYQRKVYVVPKTLGLKKSTELPQQNFSEKSQQTLTSEVLKQEINRNSNQDLTNKSDFSSLITSTLPQLHNDIIPTSPYSMDNRYLNNKSNTREKIDRFSLKESSISNSGIGNSVSNSKSLTVLQNLRGHTLDNNKEDFVKTIDFEIKTTQLLHTEKTKIINKGEDKKLIGGSIKDLHQRFFVSYEKENNKNKICDISEVEESHKTEMSVEVSLGGRILSKKVVDFEQSEQEMGN